MKLLNRKRKSRKHCHEASRKATTSVPSCCNFMPLQVPEYIVTANSMSLTELTNELSRSFDACLETILAEPQQREEDTEGIAMSHI